MNFLDIAIRSSSRAPDISLSFIPDNMYGNASLIFTQGAEMMMFLNKMF